jgi:hypothetical protein
MKSFTFTLSALAAAILLPGGTSAVAQPAATGLTNQTVLFGNPARLSVSASGKGPLSYQWQLNGTNLSKNVLVTIAGNGGAGFSADGSAATNAALSWPTGLGFGPDGSVFLIDHGLIREIDTNAIIITVAGGGSATNDGVLATDAVLYDPNSLALDASGNLYFADDGPLFEGRVCKIDTQGIITTVADGYAVYGLAAGGKDNVYMAGAYDSLVWKLSTNGAVATVAGTGIAGYSGDGGAATNAQLSQPLGLAVDAAGSLFIADPPNNCVRKVSVKGIITTMAGVGHTGFWGDGGAATNASLNQPGAVAADDLGNVFIADQGNNCVRKVSASGVITTVAGTGCLRAGTDGAPACEALLTPISLACDAFGNLFAGDKIGSRVCEVPVVSGWPVFLIAAASATDAGAYRLTVTNSAGGVTRSATITVSQPTTADGWVQAGTRALSAWDLDVAYLAFEQAVALSPSDPEANARACISRFFLITRQPAVSNYLASRFEIAPGELHAYNWVGDAQYDDNGTLEVIDSVLSVVGDLFGGAHLNTNASLNSADLISLFNTNIMPAILACDTNMARITDPNYTITLTSNDTHLIGSVTFDRGDFLLLRSLVQLLAFGSDTSQAFNFDFDINHVLALYNDNALTVQRFLVDYPNFLGKTAGMQAQVAASKAALTNGAEFYFDGSGFIRTNRPAGAIRLFNFDPSLTNLEAVFRDYLGKAVASVDTPVVFDSTNNYSVYLGAYFDSTNALRDYLPEFSGNNYVPNSLPDYTFNGLIQGVPAWKTESLLRGTFDFTPAGIYSTNLTDDSSGASGGWMLLFLPTNGQATLLAFPTNVLVFDGVSGSYTNVSAVVYESFTFTNLQPLGSWEWQTNGYPSSGAYDFTLEADFGLPFSSTFSGNLSGAAWVNQDDISPCSVVPGAFLDVAGVYSGRWTNTASGATGPMQGILADDGTFGYATFAPAADVVDGGVGIFSDNASLVCSSSQGLRVTNTLDRAGLAMSGVFVSPDTNEVFSLRRTDFIAGDTLPTITSAPANQNGVVGGTVTFQVAASGSPPLCYQWYSNGVPIFYATNTTLVLSKLTSAAIAATYSVEVHNVVGAAQASATCQANPPPTAVLSITNSPTGSFHFSLNNVPAEGSVVIETSTNLTVWLPFATNSATGVPLNYAFPATNRPAKFFRVKLIP